MNADRNDSDTLSACRCLIRWQKYIKCWVGCGRGLPKNARDWSLDTNIPQRQMFREKVTVDDRSSWDTYFISCANFLYDSNFSRMSHLTFNQFDTFVQFRRWNMWTDGLTILVCFLHIAIIFWVPLVGLFVLIKSPKVCVSIEMSAWLIT